MTQKNKALTEWAKDMGENVVKSPQSPLRRCLPPPIQNLKFLCGLQICLPQITTPHPRIGPSHEKLSLMWTSADLASYPPRPTRNCIPYGYPLVLHVEEDSLIFLHVRDEGLFYVREESLFFPFVEKECIFFEY